MDIIRPLTRCPPSNNEKAALVARLLQSYPISAFSVAEGRMAAAALSAGGL